jgi:flavin reductase (DIM6/NTAB) family NADH-FMN oxidoreductase RutF
MDTKEDKSNFNKVAIDSNKVIWPGSTQLAPVPSVLVGCGNNKEYNYNLLTIGWTGIINSVPPMLSISVRKERFSYDIIKNLKDFTVNIPSTSLVKATDLCGVISGKDGDKFAKANLTPIPASNVTAPIVKECPLNLECRTTQIIPLGSHDLFLAEIVAVEVDKNCINSKGAFDPGIADLLCYAHGHYYSLGECLGHFGFSVKKKATSNIRASKNKKPTNNKLKDSKKNLSQKSFNKSKFQSKKSNNKKATSGKFTKEQ